MIRYHDFTNLQTAEQFLTELRAGGGLGYLLSYNSEHHQVRELV